MDFEQFKIIANHQGLLLEWVKDPKTPVPIREAVRELVEGFDQLKKELDRQVERVAAFAVERDQLLQAQQIIMDSSRGLQTARESALDDLNNGVDEQPIRGGEYSGWNLVGGIRLGRPVAITDEAGTPMVKVSISPLMQNVQTEFDVFRLAAKRNQFGELQAIVIDLTSTFG